MQKGNRLVMSGGALKRGLSLLLGGTKASRAGEFDVARATTRDIDELVAMAETFRSEHSSDWGQGTLAQWARWQVKGSVQSADHVVVIARSGGTPVGYAAAMVDRGGPQALGKVEAVYVLPGLRGKGIADRLLGAALEGLTEKGAAHMELVVSADNARAQAFFRGFGFRDGDRVLGMQLGPEPTRIDE